MIRLAICLRATKGDSESEHWYASALGEARMEYFGCCALATEQQWEMRTLALHGGLWRSMDPASLALAEGAPVLLPQA